MGEEPVTKGLGGNPRVAIREMILSTSMLLVRGRGSLWPQDQVGSHVVVLVTNLVTKHLVSDENTPVSTSSLA